MGHFDSINMTVVALITALFSGVFLIEQLNGSGGTSRPMGGQDHQKVISFDHFVQENAHFFSISLKVGGQDKVFWAFVPSCPPLVPPLSNK